MKSNNVKKAARVHRIIFRIVLIICAVCLAVDIVCWLTDGNSIVESFALFHMQKVFPVITQLYSGLTSIPSFSVGEVLIIIAVCGVPLSILLFIALMIIKRRSPEARKTIRRVYGYVYGWIFAFILVTETLNCFILYDTPSFAEIYSYPGEKYTPAQLEELAVHLIVKTNGYAEQVKRDSSGKFVLTADLDSEAEKAMSALAEDYPQLGGYYVTPKPVKNSFFMSQLSLMGIYFPFTMEANYNDDMYSLNLPDTVCHELAHTKGFIREDEANFIGFLACDASENADYNYSGYLRALKYVIGQCEDNCSEKTVSMLYGMLSENVITDWNSNVDYWIKVEESDEGVFKTETVEKVSDKAMETSLKINGVEDGKKSYGRMVDLLLDWYFMNAENGDEKQ